MTDLSSSLAGFYPGSLRTHVNAVGEFVAPARTRIMKQLKAIEKAKNQASKTELISDLLSGSNQVDLVTLGTESAANLSALYWYNCTFLTAQQSITAAKVNWPALLTKSKRSARSVSALSARVKALMTSAFKDYCAEPMNQEADLRKRNATILAKLPLARLLRQELSEPMSEISAGLRKSTTLAKRILIPYAATYEKRKGAQEVLTRLKHILSSEDNSVDYSFSDAWRLLTEIEDFEREIYTRETKNWMSSMGASVHLMRLYGDSAIWTQEIDPHTPFVREDEQSAGEADNADILEIVKECQDRTGDPEPTFCQLWSKT